MEKQEIKRKEAEGGTEFSMANHENFVKNRLETNLKLIAKLIGASAAPLGLLIMVDAYLPKTGLNILAAQPLDFFVDFATHLGLYLNAHSELFKNSDPVNTVTLVEQIFGLLMAYIGERLMKIKLK